VRKNGKLENWKMSIIERNNINRGFTKLRVWQDSIELYKLTCKVFSDFPFELKKISSNSIDASHSICRNISEGYCRRSIKEYLNHLNIALASCGELFTCFYSCYKAGQLKADQFEEIDALHYRVENTLLKLIKSLQEKQKSKGWEDSFLDKKI
jgi:four helix bundle protein